MNSSYWMEPSLFTSMQLNLSFKVHLTPSEWHLLACCLVELGVPAAPRAPIGPKSKAQLGKHARQLADRDVSAAIAVPGLEDGLQIIRRHGNASAK